MNIDEHTDNAIEIVSEGAKLTSNLILFVLRSASEMLEGKDKDNVVIDGKTKDGKQKINDLIKKHKSGIESLESNLTKEQLMDYQKELKKLGVDFSVVKNGKDNYSFFFAGEQSGIIEKALKNVLEQKTQVRNDNRVKDAELDLNAEKHNFSEKEIDEVKKVYDKTVDMSDKKEIEKEVSKLSPEGKILFDKMKHLDEIEKEVQGKISDLFKDLKNDNSVQKNNNVIELDTGLPVKEDNKAIDTKNNSKKILREKLSQLDDKQLDLFLQRMTYESEATSPEFNSTKAYQEANKLTEMQKNFSKEEIQKINNLDAEIRNLNIYDKDLENNPKLTPNEILNESKQYKKEREKTREDRSNAVNIKKFSIQNLKQIDERIKAEEKEKPVIRNKEQSL